MAKSMIGDLQVADISSTLTGYRVWKDFHTEKGFASPYFFDYWQGQQQIAFCALSGHPAPDKDCQCGLYGFFEQKKALQKSQPIMGVCEYWGKAEVHKDGLRSQRAKIKAIAYNPKESWQNEALFLAKIYLAGILFFLLLNAAMVFFGIGHGIFLLQVVAGMLISFLWRVGSQFYKHKKEEPSANTKRKEIEQYCQKHNIVFCTSYKELQKYHTHKVPPSLKQS